MKEFKVVPIRNGTVLDHIAAGKSLEILSALGFPISGSSKVVSVSMNLPSSSGEMKDVLKFEDLELTTDELAKIKAISPKGTLVVIRNYDIEKKSSW